MRQIETICPDCAGRTVKTYEIRAIRMQIETTCDRCGADYNSTVYRHRADGEIEVDTHERLVESDDWGYDDCACEYCDECYYCTQCEGCECDE